MILQLVYGSAATVDFSDASLLELLNVSRANNARLGITGLLLYRDGNFIQAIEGQKGTVQSLYAKLSRDPRHAGVFTFLTRDLERADFPDWSMGFRNLRDPNLAAIPGYSEFLNVDFKSELQAPSDAAKSKVQKLLEVFRDSIR